MDIALHLVSEIKVGVRADRHSLKHNPRTLTKLKTTGTVSIAWVKCIMDLREQPKLDPTHKILCHYVSSVHPNQQVIFACAISHSDDGEYESRLSQSKLLQLCEYDPVITFVKACDHLLYQTLVEILIPDVLRPIPGMMIHP